MEKYFFTLLGTLFPHLVNIYCFQKLGINPVPSNYRKNWTITLKSPAKKNQKLVAFSHSLLIVLMSYLGGEVSSQTRTLSKGDPFNFILENSPWPSLFLQKLLMSVSFSIAWTKREMSYLIPLSLKHHSWQRQLHLL